MKCFIWIKCVVMASNLLNTDDNEANEHNICAGEFLMQPNAPGICSVCKTEVFSTNENMGNGAQSTFFRGGKCPHCSYNTIHLGCALTSFSPIECHSCGGLVCRRSPELDAFVIGRCRSKSSQHIGINEHLDALRYLDSMDDSLQVLTLYSYDMTKGELLFLKDAMKCVASLNGMGKHRLNIISNLDSIIQIKHLVYIQPDHLLAILAKMQSIAFAIVLPMLETIITPHFVAQAGEEQTMALIKLLARHKGVNAHICDALVKKITTLVDIIGKGSFSNDGIKNLLSALISSDSCAMIKHLIGRHRFSHQLMDSEICDIIEQASAIYPDNAEASTPLLMFLISGNTTILPSKFQIELLSSILLERNDAISATPIYKKLQHIIISCALDYESIKNAITRYARVPNSSDCEFSEDLFCAVIGNLGYGNGIVRFMAEKQDLEAAYIVRHLPNSWLDNNTDIYINIAKQAISQNKIETLEVALTALMNVRQAPEHALEFLKALLESDYRDYMGLVLKIADRRNFLNLRDKDMLSRVMKQICVFKMEWCTPWLEKYSKISVRSRQVIREHSQIIIDVIVHKSFPFTPLFLEIIRYDVESTFLIENLRMYLGALLKASTGRHIVQRLLVEICSVPAFGTMVNEDAMASIYELFKSHQDCFFYLDAFYYAMPNNSAQKQCFKTIVVRDLEKVAAERNYSRTAHNGNNAPSQEENRNQPCNPRCGNIICERCFPINELAFSDLLTVLRISQTNH